MLRNLKIKIASYSPNRKTVLAQYKKLKQDKKESKNHFESYYPEILFVKVLK